MQDHRVDNHDQEQFQIDHRNKCKQALEVGHPQDQEWEIQ